jgi:hypothetical protein
MIEHTCYFCGTIFLAYRSAKRKYCSAKCANKANRGRLSGNKNPTKHKDVRAKMSAAQRKRYAHVQKRTCIDCGCVIKSHNKAKRCKKCYNNSIKGNNHWSRQSKYSGKNHPCYKGGRKRDMLYSTLFNKKIKKQIFERDNYICRICGVKGGLLHCHHIDYNKFNTALENLVTLCPSCHAKTNSYKNREFWKKFFGHEHKQYCLMIGRYQVATPHAGHEALARKMLDSGKNVCVLLRESELDNKNPYGFNTRREAFEKLFEKEILAGQMIVMPICDIESVFYGRGVGYRIEQIELDNTTEKISGTSVRKQTEPPEDIMQKALSEMPKDLRELLEKTGL